MQHRPDQGRTAVQSRNTPIRARVPTHEVEDRHCPAHGQMDQPFATAVLGPPAPPQQWRSEEEEENALVAQDRKKGQGVRPYLLPIQVEQHRGKDQDESGRKAELAVQKLAQRVERSDHEQQRGQCGYLNRKTPPQHRIHQKRGGCEKGKTQQVIRSKGFGHNARFREDKTENRLQGPANLGRPNSALPEQRP